MGVLSRIRETFRRTPAPETGAVAESLETPTAAQVRRVGYEYGLPLNIQNTSSLTSATSERQQVLAQLHQAYMACNWVSASVDLIARTVTAGGLQVVAETVEEGVTPPETPEVLRLKRLLRFTNPREDMVQLLRNVATDLLLFGDAYIEIVSLLGEPVALYTLDATTMTVVSDQHGEVSGYIQDVDGVRTAKFGADQVVHISLDAPRGGLYGVSPAQKALLPITAWLFTMATLKECFRRGDPPRLHVDLAHFQDTDVQRWREQYRVFNLGPKAVGEPVLTTGGGGVQVLDSRKVTDYLDADRQLRDQIIAAFGVPPAKLGIIETGNLGSGSGESQNKTFQVNTIIPIANLILEKLNYHLLQVGFGITDWHLEFTEIDYRDSMVVEDIREKRLHNGAYCVDVETEILTGAGWKQYTELQVGEKVLTLNHETGESEWQECQEVCVFPAVKREMVRMNMRGHSSLTTTNHRWPVERYNKATRTWKKLWATSETLQYFDRIPTAARNADLPVEAVYDDAFVELIAWFWTESHAAPNERRISIYQVKQEGVERIRRALEKTFGPASEVRGDGRLWHESAPSKNGKVTFRVLSSHGHLFRDLVEDHVVSTDFLMALTQEQLELFIEVSLMADGNNAKSGQQVLGQRRKAAAEQFQLACILSGRSATLRERVFRRDGYRMWMVNVNKVGTVSPKKAAATGFSAVVETVAHDGVVWCPVTPNQSWMARRDGTVYFTGNTLNRWRAEIGEPPVEGGDDPIFMERTFVADWANMQDLAKSFIVKNLGAAATGGAQDPNDLAPPASGDGPTDPEDGPGLSKDATQGTPPRESLTEKKTESPGDRVYEQLLENYPAEAIGWVKDVRWSGPETIPLKDVSFAHEKEWRASHEPERVAKFVKKLRKGRHVDPAVLIQTPDGDKLIIVDGHHRALAYRKVGQPVVAWIGRTRANTGPWDELHDSQYRHGRKPPQEEWDDLYRRCLDEALAAL